MGHAEKDARDLSPFEQAVKRAGRSRRTFRARGLFDEAEFAFRRNDIIVG